MSHCNPTARSSALGYNDSELARLNPDGSLDTGFGDQGITSTTFGGALYNAGNMTIDGSGNIVVVGDGPSHGINTTLSVGRLLADGSPDPNFGSGGLVTSYPSFVMPDRYYSDGLGGGQWESNVTINAGRVGVYDNVGIDSQGRIIVAGETSYLDGFINKLITVERFNADGSLDTTFGSGGTLATSFVSTADSTTNLDYLSTSVADFGLQMVIDSNDRIILASEYSQSDSYDITLADGSTYTVTHDGGAFNGIALARFNTDGTPDDTFGVHGKVFTDSFGTTVYAAVGLAIDSGGDLVVTAESTDGFDVARHNASDGSLDTSFGAGGQAVTDFGFDTNTVGFEILGTTLDDSDRIVAAGWAWDVGVDDSHLLLARLATDGSLDASFGTGGKVTTVLTDNDGLYAAAIDGSGRIVTGGWSGYYSGLVARFFAEPNTASLPARRQRPFSQPGRTRGHEPD